MTAPLEIELFYRDSKPTIQVMGAWDSHKNFSAKYTLSSEANRSRRTHNHEFVEVFNLWQTLPESAADEPFAANADALRKHALIVRGHCDIFTNFYASKEASKTYGTHQKMLHHKRSGYVLASMSHDGTVVVFKVAHSQSEKAMGKKAFQESKTDVLDCIKGYLETGEWK